MEFKLDRTKKYALALEGGGGRGAYEIGAWKALHEEGIGFCAVSGTSVGAINGAAVTAGDLDTAIHFWENLTYSQVMEVDDSVMKKLIGMDFLKMDLKDTARTLSETLRNRGFDISPLKATMQQAINEKAVLESDIDFYIVTFMIDEMKELVVRAKDLAEGELYDMLLASAYLPVFRSEKLGGKRYFDGGIYNRLPISALTDNGYRDIIAVELNSIGPIQKYDIPGVEVHTIKPVADIGRLMQFDPELSARNLRLGYFDAKKMMYGLSGTNYYIDRQMTESEAYSMLVRFTKEYWASTGAPVSDRNVNEKLLPALASRVKASKGDYYDVFIGALEHAAASAGIDPFVIFTERELLAKVLKVYDPASGNIPKSLIRTLPSLQLR
ncbi:MAG: patatin-like phospholipase family protein [Oscillospiraceae bacterium]|nr:patatin-like phospholipase family protein [Oscillospiraceae bacterium]